MDLPQATPSASIVLSHTPKHAPGVLMSSKTVEYPYKPAPAPEPVKPTQPGGWLDPRREFIKRQRTPK